MSLCLAAAGVALRIAASTFTLAWTHTVEKTSWSEDWRLVGDRLALVQARVQGSGAGMEPPPDARREGSFYVWEPHLPPVPDIVLRRAPQAGDWRLCAEGHCATLGDWLGRDADPVRLFAEPRGRGCAEPTVQLLARCFDPRPREGASIMRPCREE